jgi:hypothetical protein
VAAIERDAEAVLRDYAGLMPEALATMAPEDRHRIYKMLRLKVLVYPDGTGELRGMFGQGVSVGTLGITLGSSSGSTRNPVALSDQCPPLFRPSRSVPTTASGQSSGNGSPARYRA